jgi:hypothetical protein
MTSRVPSIIPFSGIALGLALLLTACSPAMPVVSGQTPPAGPTFERSVLYLDFVTQNLPRTLTGQILPLQMALFSIDPGTGERLNLPPWELGLCAAPAFGCESGEIKTLRLSLPPGDYAVGYLGSTGFASPSFYLMAFEHAEMIGGRVQVGGKDVFPDFNRKGRVSARTPILTVRPNEVAYAGLLSATFGLGDLTTTIVVEPDRRASLLAQIGLPSTALTDRPGRYQ